MMKLVPSFKLKTNYLYNQFELTLIREHRSRLHSWQDRFPAAASSFGFRHSAVQYFRPMQPASSKKREQIRSIFSLQSNQGILCLILFVCMTTFIKHMVDLFEFCSIKKHSGTRYIRCHLRFFSRLAH